MNHPEADPPRDAHRFVVYGIICLVYFFVYFHRVSTSVIAKDLLADLSADATALGFMSSMYFYIYAFEQPFVGFLADKLGPRRVVAWWSMAAAAGALVFGLAPNLTWACVGRALIGFGVGGVYVPALKALSQWFRKNEFAVLIGLLMTVGNFGAVIATTPLAWAAGTVGWRITFFIISGLTLALALAALFIIREAPAPPPEEVKTTSGGTIRAVLSAPFFWIAGAVFFGVYGTLITFQGLWAAPYLTAAYSLSRIAAGNMNMLIPVGVMVGAPVLGWATDRFGIPKARMLLGIVATYTVTWVFLIFFVAPLGKPGMCAVLFVMGFVSGGFISILWALVRENTPQRIMGAASGLLNPAPFFGVAAFQFLTGAMLDRAAADPGATYVLADFKPAFIACLIANLICLGLAFFLAGKKKAAA